MGIASIIGGLAGGGVAKVAEQVVNAVDKFVETPDEKRAAEILKQKIAAEPDKWQMEINKIEAGHRSIFVAGWRPFVGWVCGIAFGFNYIGLPLLDVIFKALNLVVIMPVLDTGTLMTLLLALLGLGSMRTYEKKAGVTQ